MKTMKLIENNKHCSMFWHIYYFMQMFFLFWISIHSLAISRALCQHTARPYPNQGQLCGAGGHCGHQGHLPQVPQQVGSHFDIRVGICSFCISK